MKYISPFEAAAIAYEDCADECERLAELAKTVLLQKIRNETQVDEEAARASVAATRGTLDGFALLARQKAKNAREEGARVLRSAQH